MKKTILFAFPFMFLLLTFSPSKTHAGILDSFFDDFKTDDKKGNSGSGGSGQHSDRSSGKNKSSDSPNIVSSLLSAIFSSHDGSSGESSTNWSDENKNRQEHPDGKKNDADRKPALISFRSDFEKDSGFQYRKPQKTVYYRPPRYVYSHKHHYYYPRFRFPVHEVVVINNHPAENTVIQQPRPAEEQPERSLWLSAGIDYLNISKDIKATGISVSLVSAGDSDKLSFGFLFNKQMFIEKMQDSHISLNFTDLALLVGRQFGNGKVELQAGARGIENIYGPNLSLNTDQWLSKYFFVNGNIGAGIIGNSTLLDLGGGIGLGNENVQLILGYRSLQSSNNDLSGPQIKFRIMF